MPGRQEACTSSAVASSSPASQARKQATVGVGEQRDRLLGARRLGGGQARPRRAGSCGPAITGPWLVAIRPASRSAANGRGLVGVPVARHSVEQALLPGRLSPASQAASAACTSMRASAHAVVGEAGGALERGGSARIASALQALRAPACSSASDAVSSVPAAAAARCHARRSSSWSGSTAASARCACPTRAECGVAVDGGADQWVLELDAAAAMRTSPASSRRQQPVDLHVDQARRPSEHLHLAAVAGGGEQQAPARALVECRRATQVRGRDARRHQYRSAFRRECQLVLVSRQLE